MPFDERGNSCWATSLCRGNHHFRFLVVYWVRLENMAVRRKAPYSILAVCSGSIPAIPSAPPTKYSVRSSRALRSAPRPSCKIRRMEHVTPPRSSSLVEPRPTATYFALRTEHDDGIRGAAGRYPVEVRLEGAGHCRRGSSCLEQIARGKGRGRRHSAMLPSSKYELRRT
jgi:hypothetical protein